MRLIVIGLISSFLVWLGARLQTPDLVAVSAEVVTVSDIFGGERQVVQGQLSNNGQSAYQNIAITVEAIDGNGEIIGEGFGYIVNACGDALLDEALQPAATARFSADFEQFSDGDIAQLTVTASGEPIAPRQLDISQIYSGLRGVTNREVALVEWLDPNNLRYGVGCAGDVFTNLDWYAYDVAQGLITPIEHPNAAQVTEAFILQTGINKLSQSGEEAPFLYERSFLTFPTTARRVVYQNDLHTIISAEVDGSFKRLIHEGLHPYSLQGFIWLPQGRFLAYYFGAYGDPVRYFTANVEGQLISALVEDVTPSVTVPGPTEDGLYAVISGTFEQGTGYYLKSTSYDENIFLFEAEPPGNNWPAPIYYRKSDTERYIYVVRPVDGVPTLQCFERDANVLHTLTRLPFQLDTDERAWSWVAPDYSQLAISANGMDGGLWLVDLNAFNVCR